jgi:hypothetical protein
MIISKKGGIELATSSLIKLVLVSLCLFTLIGITIMACSTLTTSSAEKHAEMYFDVFTMRLNNLIDFTPNQPYSSTSLRLVLPRNYYMVAFSSADSVKVNIDGEQKTWIKPEDCDLFNSCLCLYDKKPETRRDKKDKHVVKCNKMPAHTISATNLMNTNFPSNSVFEFLGVDQTETYQNIKNNYESLLPGVNDDKLALKTGLYDRNLFSLALKLEDTSEIDSSAITFYVEKILMPDSDKILILLSPYNSNYNIRKYFIHKYESDDPECNSKYLNYVLTYDNSNPEKNMTTYCTYDFNQPGKIQKVTREISLCPENERIYTACVCESRVTNYGYCITKFNEDYVGNYRVLSARPNN